MFEQPKNRPTFSSSKFTWKNGRGTASIPELGFGMPRDGFYILSERTKQKKLFVADRLENERNEFFDGEATAYISIDGKTRVTVWVG